MDLNPWMSELNYWYYGIYLPNPWKCILWTLILRILILWILILWILIPWILILWINPQNTQIQTI
jgi:hypothetical protein